MAKPHLDLDALTRARNSRAAQRSRVLWGLINEAVSGSWRGWLDTEEGAALAAIDAFDARTPDFAPWSDTINGYMDQVTIDAMSDTLVEHGITLGPDWSLPNPRAMAALESRRNQIVGLSDELWESDLRPALVDSIARGDSIDEAALRLDGKLDEFYVGRARTIARTTIISATNAAQDEVGRQFQFGARLWVATTDSRTRESHALANGQRAEDGEPFMVGGYELAYPGDPSGPPQETINCRCTFIYPDLDPDVNEPPPTTQETNAFRNAFSAVTRVQTPRDIAARTQTMSQRTDWLAKQLSKLQWKNARRNPLRIAYNEANDAYETMFESVADLFTGGLNPLNRLLAEMTDGVKILERHVLHGRKITSTARRRVRRQTEHILGDKFLDRLTKADADGILARVERLAAQTGADVADLNESLTEVAQVLERLNIRAPRPTEFTAHSSRLRAAKPARSLKQGVGLFNQRIHHEADRLMAFGRKIDHRVQKWVDDPDMDGFVRKMQQNGVIARPPSLPDGVVDVVNRGKSELAKRLEKIVEASDDVLLKLQREGVIARRPNLPDLDDITFSGVLDQARQTESLGKWIEDQGRRLQRHRRELAGTLPGTKQARNIDNKVRQAWRGSRANKAMDDMIAWLDQAEDPFLALESFLDYYAEPAADILRIIDDDLPAMRARLNILGHRFPDEAASLSPAVRLLDEISEGLIDAYVRPFAQIAVDARKTAANMSHTFESARGMVRTYQRVGEAYARSIDQMLDARQEGINVVARILAAEGDATGKQLVALGTRVARTAREGRLMLRDPIKYPADVIRGTARSLRHLAENTDQLDRSVDEVIGLLDRMADTADLADDLLFDVADLADDDLALLADMGELLTDALDDIPGLYPPMGDNGLPELPRFLPVVDDLLPDGARLPDGMRRLSDGDLAQVFPRSFNGELPDPTDWMPPVGRSTPDRTPTMLDDVIDALGYGDDVAVAPTGTTGVSRLDLPDGPDPRAQVKTFLEQLQDDIAGTGSIRHPDELVAESRFDDLLEAMTPQQRRVNETYRSAQYRWVNQFIRSVDEVDRRPTDIVARAARAADGDTAALTADDVDEVLALMEQHRRSSATGDPLPLHWLNDVFDQDFEALDEVIAAAVTRLDDSPIDEAIEALGGIDNLDFVSNARPVLGRLMADGIIEKIDPGDYLSGPLKAALEGADPLDKWITLLGKEPAGFVRALDDAGTNVPSFINDLGLWKGRQTEIADALLGSPGDYLRTAIANGDQRAVRQFTDMLERSIDFPPQVLPDDMNDWERFQHSAIAGELLDYFDSSAATTLDEGTILWRGLDGSKMFGSSDIDEIAKWRGVTAELDNTVMSTTTMPDHAMNYATNVKNADRPTLLMMHIEDGLDLPYMPGNLSEGELILPPGTVGTFGDILDVPSLDVIIVRVDIRRADNLVGEAADSARRLADDVDDLVDSGDTAGALDLLEERLARLTDATADTVEDMLPALPDESIIARLTNDIPDIPTSEFDRFTEQAGRLALPERSPSTIAALEARDKARFDQSRKLLADLRADLRDTAREVADENRGWLESRFDGETTVEVSSTMGRPEDEWFYERLSTGQRLQFIKQGYVRPVSGWTQMGADVLADIAGESGSVDNVMAEWVDRVQETIHAQAIADGNAVGLDVDVSFLERGLDDFDPNMLVRRRGGKGVGQRATADARIYLTERTYEIQKRDAEWNLGAVTEFKHGPEPWNMSYERWREELYDIIDGNTKLSPTQEDERLEELIPPNLYPDMSLLPVDDLESAHHEIVEAAIRAEYILPF